MIDHFTQREGPAQAVERLGKTVSVPERAAMPCPVKPFSQRVVESFQQGAVEIGCSDLQVYSGGSSWVFGMSICCFSIDLAVLKY